MKGAIVKNTLYHVERMGQFKEYSQRQKVAASIFGE